MQTKPSIFFLFRKLFLGICCFFYFNSFGQFKISYETLTPSDKVIVNRLFVSLSKAAPVNDAFEFRKSLRVQLESLYEEGFLAATIDSITNESDNNTVWWNIGVQYKLARLRTDQNDDALLSQAGLRDRLYRNKAFTPARYAKLINSILQWTANNGYPFALVKLDSVHFGAGTIDAKLFIDKGPLILLDTAEVRGDARLAKVYLLNYLSIKPGSPYNEIIIERIGSRLKELPFVSEGRDYEVEFVPGLARPVLFLKQKKASQFNGIIGFQPDNIQKGKTIVTGDVQLRLHNSFGRAELLDVNWKNPQPRTQDLKVKFNYPFLFNTPFGLDADIALYKKDTIYLDFNRQIGLRYYLRGNNSLKVFAGLKSTNLISTKGYTNVTVLPAFADIITNNFGIGLQFEKLDYRLNPRQGYAIEFTMATGVRKIKKNAKINELVYDSLDLNTTQYNGEAVTNLYLPISARGVFNFGVSGGFVESPAIFENELFRIGGLKSLRGFDEGSILASRYLTANAEFRFILEQNSYLLLFYNQAYYENRSNRKFFSDTPYGFGAGITFETKLGIFSFTYALGSQQNNPILIRAAKIHFGLVNYF